MGFVQVENSCNPTNICPEMQATNIHAVYE